MIFCLNSLENFRVCLKFCAIIITILKLFPAIFVIIYCTVVYYFCTDMKMLEINPIFSIHNKTSTTFDVRSFSTKVHIQVRHLMSLIFRKSRIFDLSRSILKPIEFKLSTLRAFVSTPLPPLLIDYYHNKAVHLESTRISSIQINNKLYNTCVYFFNIKYNQPWDESIQTHQLIRSTSNNNNNNRKS